MKAMTIKELVEELQHYEENMKVLIEGEFGQLFSAREVEMDDEQECVVIK